MSLGVCLPNRCDPGCFFVADQHWLALSGCSVSADGPVIGWLPGQEAVENP